MSLKFLKVSTKAFRGKRGYTLLEICAMAAVTAALVAIIVPVLFDRIEKGKVSTAKDDCRMIGDAISRFHTDLDMWPAYNGTTKDHYLCLRSGDDTGAPGSGTDDPSASAMKGWPLADADHTDQLENHLVVDNNEYRNNGYNWKGPYTNSLSKKKDPWGHNYLVWVKGLHTKGDPKEYGWVISAGPDGKLDTDTNDASLGVDDIGIMLYPAAD